MRLPRVLSLLLLAGLLFPIGEASAQRGTREIGESLRSIGERVAPDSAPPPRARGGASSACREVTVTYRASRISLCLPAGWQPVQASELGQPGLVHGWRSDGTGGAFAVLGLMETPDGALLRAATPAELTPIFDAWVREMGTQELARVVVPETGGVPFVAMEMADAEAGPKGAIVLGMPLGDRSPDWSMIFTGATAALPLPTPPSQATVDARLEELLTLWRTIRVR